MSVLRQITLLALSLFVTACGAEEINKAPDAPQPVQTAPAAKTATVNSFDAQALKDRFTNLGVTVKDVKPAEIAGLVEIQTNSGVLFASPDGKYFIAGTLYKLDKNGQYKDVFAERQAPLNAAKIAKFSDSVIEYKAEHEKYVVTVFTDISCAYCERLHSQMKGYNALGITVRYMAYPRQGLNSPIADQMAQIWCTEDPKEAMHRVKTGGQVGPAIHDIKLCKKLIAQHYQLGQELGITGTPSIFFPSGKMIGGYLPPAQLFQRLEADPANK